MARLTNTTEPKSAGQIIADQIGGGAFFMYGAKQIVASENYLLFRIGRNAGNWNKIKITINGLDLYEVTFMKIRKLKVTREITAHNVPCDQLHKTIKNETGLASRLF